MSFGYSVLGFGSSATHVSAVAAPDSAVIKTADGGVSDAVDWEKYNDELRSWAISAIVPTAVGGSTGDRMGLDANGDVDRFNMIKTVNGTIATHAWTAVISKTSGSGTAHWVGGSATATSSTSGAFTTPAVDASTITGGFSADEGIITFDYTATNAGGSDAATQVKIYWAGVG